MALTSEQRAEINRQNARSSTGPKSEAGKAKSRQNALKHGLRAESLALPTEDAEAVATRSAAWNHYYQPESPAAQHLVNTCVQATLLSDRCQKYHHAVLTRQIRQADQTWDDRRADEIAAHQALLQTDAATAVRLLKRSGAGLRWLIKEWEDLEARLRKSRKWEKLDRLQAVSLMGEPPDTWFTRESFKFWLKIVEESLAELRPRLVDYEAGIDAPDRAEAADRALLPEDPQTARLFLRYQAEARTSFHRAYSTLLKTLENDRDRDADETLSEPPAPTPEPEPEPAETVSPNEPKSTPNVEPDPPKTPAVPAVARPSGPPTLARERLPMVQPGG